MSIIYDALRKSQQARAAKAPIAIARKTRINRKNLILTLLILTCMFASAVILTMSIETARKLPILGSRLPTAKPLPIALQVSAAPRLLLDGVFLSDTEKLAMINRRSYHEGDTISGLKIVSIAFDEVQLRSKSRSITLRNALTQLD